MLQYRRKTTELLQVPRYREWVEELKLALDKTDLGFLCQMVNESSIYF